MADRKKSDRPGVDWGMRRAGSCQRLSRGGPAYPRRASAEPAPAGAVSPGVLAQPTTWTVADFVPRHAARADDHGDSDHRLDLALGISPRARRQRQDRSCVRYPRVLRVPAVVALMGLRRQPGHPHHAGPDDPPAGNREAVVGDPQAVQAADCAKPRRPNRTGLAATARRERAGRVRHRDLPSTTIPRWGSTSTRSTTTERGCSARRSCCTLASSSRLSAVLTGTGAFSSRCAPACERPSPNRAAQRARARQSSHPNDQPARVVGDGRRRVADDLRSAGRPVDRRAVSSARTVAPRGRVFGTGPNDFR